MREFLARLGGRFSTRAIAALAGLTFASGVAMPTFAAKPPPFVDPAAVLVPHTFVYVAGGPLKSVHLAGTFNGWNKDANAMTVDADGKTWRLTLKLPYGKAQYKFVLDGERWIPDPAPTAHNEGDGNGNTNSILLIAPDDYARPASPDDGVIATSALLHETAIPYRNYDRGYLTLSLRVRPDDVRSVALVANGKRVPMHETTHDDLYARYSARIPWDRKHDLAYDFALTDGGHVSGFGTNGLTDSVSAAQPFVLDASTFHPFIVPSWVEKSVLYQIFPDRFEDGDKSNDPPNVQPWDGIPTYSNRFGGDVAGIQQRLGYLTGLGISAIYFNPVFASPSNHRYDATDYEKIDPQFGTNAEFAALSKEMQKRGIRTIMDFAFNHTATNSAPFADLRKNGAASPYASWYFVHSYPIQMQPKPTYEAWFGYPSMPKLNVLNPATHDYLLSVADYWATALPLAGMRLDAANEVDMRFWRDLRTHEKALHPDMYILGEVWGDGTPWLGGDQWDAVMNYPFRDACLHFFADGNTTPTQFTNRLMANYGSYVPQVSRALMNMLSTHDTPRFLTLCHADADPESLERLAATVQFTWAGAPSIYYGDELGMEGGKDPDNRRAMRWDLATPTNPMLAYYKRLVALRNATPALQSGDPQILLADDAAGTLAYARVLDNHAAVVALNRSKENRTVTIALPTALCGGKGGIQLKEALTGQMIAVAPGQTTLQLPLPARTAAVLLPASEAPR